MIRTLKEQSEKHESKNKRRREMGQREERYRGIEFQDIYDASMSTTRLVNPFKRAGILQDLPLTIAGKQFVTIPDTGSAVNAIDYETLRTLHSDEVIVMEDDVDCPESFRLGDSSMTAAIGQIELPCWFADKPDQQQSVIFMVFDRLADGVQAILGAPFLNVNQIFTHFFHLLMPRKRLDIAIPRILRLNCSRLQMKIHLDEELVLAYPDTGSELDLVSTEYARRRNLIIMDLNPNDENCAQLADGKIIHLDGKVLLTVAMPNMVPGARDEAIAADERDRYDRIKPEDAISTLLETLTITETPRAILPVNAETTADELSQHRIFYVFRDLGSDVLLSQSILHSVDAFKSYSNAFVGPETLSDGRDLNAIFKLSNWQRRWCDFLVRTQETPEALSSTEAGKQPCVT